jgi:predicted ATP-grasp superfamily ATP-dependent carboligase
MEDFVPYKLAKKLEEKGFNPQKQSNYLYYNGELVEVKDHYNISPYEIAPTISQVLKWLREEKKIEVVVLGQNYIEGPYFADVFTKDGLMNKAEPYPKYELAATAGIEYVIDNLI